MSVAFEKYIRASTTKTEVGVTATAVVVVVVVLVKEIGMDKDATNDIRAINLTPNTTIKQIGNPTAAQPITTNQEDSSAKWYPSNRTTGPIILTRPGWIAGQTTILSGTGHRFALTKKFH